MHGTRLAGLLRALNAEVRPAISSRSRATDHARHYGCFLGFLDRRGLLQPDAQAAANVTPENVDLLHRRTEDRVCSMTVHGSICKLRRVAQYIAPGS